MADEKWHKSCHAPINLKQLLFGLSVTYAAGSPSMKSVVRIPNSQTDLSLSCLSFFGVAEFTHNHLLCWVV
jgi:hypothetical protein